MIWITSDEHYGHFNIIKYCNRPFKHIDDMNDQLIERHNKLVGRDDIVYRLRKGLKFAAKYLLARAFKKVNLIELLTF